MQKSLLCLVVAAFQNGSPSQRNYANLGIPNATLQGLKIASNEIKIAIERCEVKQVAETFDYKISQKTLSQQVMHPIERIERDIRIGKKRDKG